MSNDEAPTSFVYTDRPNPKVKVKREASFTICNHETLDIQNSILLQPGVCGPASQSHLTPFHMHPLQIQNLLRKKQ